MKRIQTNDHVNPSRIIGVQFSIMSPEEIINNSTVEVVTKDANQGVGGLFDSKMGVLKQGTYCPTDGFTYLNCPGYFGHIVLARPVFFIQFIKDIVRVSKCVCCKCGKLLVNKQQYKHVANMTVNERWNFMGKVSTKKRCGEKMADGCGARQPTKVRIEGFATILATWKMGKGEPDETKELTPELLIKLFKQISDDDVNFMGLNSVWSRPENMICSVLPIAPPAVRPSVEQDGGSNRSEDDLTHIYMNIIKNNGMLTQKIRENAKAEVIQKHTQIIQYFVAMIANNKVSGASPFAQTSGRPLQCVRDRLDAKRGRIRANLMGKRVNFSARSVITGDPNVSISELGVPKKIAMNLTKPVRVNKRNRNFLTMLMQNGPDVYPGAKNVDCVGGDKINLRAVDRMSIRLSIGDVVHRHLMDGDAVLFNRQPSLHKMSMMCHIVRVMEHGNTFRFNVAVTAPYNADFDGDEMNLHVPQDIVAEIELRHLPAVIYQIISPSKNSSIIGIFQDNMLGSDQFTRPGITFTVAHAMKLLAMYPHVDTTKFEGKTRITSFEILSQITPPITLKIKTKRGDMVEIRNGTWIGGQLDKSCFDASTTGILQRICNDFGNQACVDFINDLQNIITEYMKTQSFSVGISDLIINSATKAQIAHSVVEGKENVLALTNKLRMGLFENNSAYSNAVEFETQVSNILAEARSKMEKIGKDSLSATNRFMQIVSCGAKGSQINISQMTTCLGQQSIEGKRAPNGFDNRTLPHFNKYDDSAPARGFVDSSYIQGLGPHEMFFHAMAGRIGLIDTAVKTSQTGYAQRRLVKSMEDIVVLYDGTARNHMGKIVQFAYGDDGFDSIKVETQPLPLVQMSVEDIYMKYDLVASDPAARLLDIFTQATKLRISRQRTETMQKCQEYIDRMIRWRDLVVANVFMHKDDTQVRLPVSFSHIIGNLHGNLELENRIVDITPLEAFELIEEYYQKITTYSSYVENNELFAVLYYYYLSPRDLLYDKRFNRNALVLLLETVFMRFKQAIVHPGEMVGVIAAQSVGEPTTQLTLNTFHNTGVASKANVTRGVPRIDEILRLTENPKNPSLTITPFAYDEQDPARTSNYASIIECTLLRDIVRTVQVIYDPNDATSIVSEDQLMLNQYREFQKQFGMVEQVDPDALSKWIIRLEFDPRTMLDKNITMDDVHFAVTSMYGSLWDVPDANTDDTGGDVKAKRGVNGVVHCVFSDFNDAKLIFRIRIGAFTGKSASVGANGLDISDEINYLKSAQDYMLSKIVLRGVSGISKVIPRKLKNMTVLTNGKHVQQDVWVLDTTGTNMLDVLGLPFIDYKRTLNNDIREVQDVLGIEAARQVVLNEFTEVMEFSSVYINYHHLSLLTDRMSYSKDMVAVFRNGINMDNTGPIAKATFEMHTEMFLNAAKHGELDTMRGVSANVMCGQHGHYGTHAFQVHVDLQEFEKKNAMNITDDMPADGVNVYDVDNIIEKMFDEVTNHRREAIDDKCSIDNVIIPNYLSTATTVTEKGACLDDGYDMF